MTAGSSGTGCDFTSKDTWCQAPQRASQRALQPAGLEENTRPRGVWGCDRTGHQVAPSPNPWCARMWPKSVSLGTQGQCRGLGSLQQARGSSHSACGTQDLSSPQMPTGSEASQLSSFREHRAALRKQAASIRQHAAVSTITDRIHRADVHPYSAQLHQGT